MRVMFKKTKRDLFYVQLQLLFIMRYSYLHHEKICFNFCVLRYDEGATCSCYASQHRLECCWDHQDHFHWERSQDLLLLMSQTLPELQVCLDTDQVM